MSALLTQSQLLKLSRASVLLKVAGEALSAFEAGLISEAHGRWLSLGRQADVTDAEWTVIDAAIDAMDAHRADRQRASA